MTNTQAVQERGRLTARVPLNVQELIEQAASTSGATVSQFITQAAVEAAKRTLENEHIIRLTTNGSALFHKLLLTPPPPTERLIRAVAEYEERITTNENGNTTFEFKT